jgi:putative ABC transport system permease protein
MVLRHALLIVLIRLVVGLAGSFALTRVIKTALYGVTVTDPATYVGISALLLLVAIIACLIPTRRAVAVHPTIALRYE